MALRYFKSGATVWNSAASWSATSSAGVDNAGVPTINASAVLADDVIFDSGSGSCNVNIVVGSTSQGIASINFTGYTGTITMSNNIHIANGSTGVTLGSGNVTILGTSNLYINGSCTLTSGGGSWGGNLAFGSTATRTLASDFIITGTISVPVVSQTITINGAFNLKGNGLSLSSGVQGTSTIVLTGGIWSGNLTVRNSITFDGNVTVTGLVNWSPSVANGAATLKWTSGTITTTSSTLNTTLTGTTGITIFDTFGMTWAAITITSNNSRMTINSEITATGAITLQCLPGGTTLTFDGTSSFNTTGNLVLNQNNVHNITFAANSICGGFNKTGTSSNPTTLNGFNLTINGDLVMGLGLLAGTTSLKLGSGGIWTAGGSGALIRNSIEFIGNYTVGSIALPTVYWYPTVANGAATLKYTSGTITTSGSTLNTALLTTASIVNFDTGTMVWNNITFPGVAGTVVPVLVSDLRCSGILTNGANNNFTPSGSGAIRAGSYTAIAGSVHTLTTDWYFSSFTFNATLFNTNRVFIDTLLTPSAINSVLGAAAGSTTEFVMVSGSIVGLGGSSGFNVPVTISPTIGNTVTATGGIRIGNNVARTLKFDTTGGGTFNAGTSAISFGNTASTLTIDLSGAGIINLNSCTISNGTVTMTISVTPGSASFNSGTSTLNISLGGTTLNTPGISWFNITTAGHTHTLNSSLVSTGTFQMNAVSTFTNGNLYWDPQGTLSLGTGAVGFTFTVPRTVTVQNLVLNSASAGSAMILNSNTINVNGNLTLAFNDTGAGSTLIKLTGVGTWSGNFALKNNLTIDTVGTVIFGANIAYNTGTLTYTAGTIDYTTNLSTLNVSANTNFENLGGSGFGLYNLNVTGSTITVNTTGPNIYNTLTLAGNTTWTGTSTIGWTCKSVSAVVSGAIQTHIFKALTTYNVGTLSPGLLTLTGSSLYTINWRSATPSSYVYFNLGSGSTQFVRYVTATDIDSSGGLQIRNRYGVLTRTINWLVTNLTKAKTWVDIQE